MNRVIAIPQGVTPGGNPWAVAGGGIVACTDPAVVRVAPALTGGYTRVQLCGAYVPSIDCPQYPIVAPIVCLSSIKGGVLGVVSAGHVVNSVTAAFAYASAPEFDLYLVDPMSLEKIPFASIQGNMVISLQFQ